VYNHVDPLTPEAPPANRARTRGTSVGDGDIGNIDTRRRDVPWFDRPPLISNQVVTARCRGSSFPLRLTRSLEADALEATDDRRPPSSVFALRTVRVQ